MARDRLLKKFLRQRFQVTLLSGATFDGLLDEWDEKHLIFIDSHVITSVDDMRVRHVLVDGRLFLARSTIDYMQALPA